MKVSVCVPAYDRPKMVSQLARSFLAQTYINKELCISDDSRTRDSQHALESLSGTAQILYRRNVERAGFSANLREALRMASGDLLVVLGDDDMFASATALEHYVDAFTRHPSADFGYANLIQVDELLCGTLLYRFFDRLEYARPGREAIERLWLHSILITGIALRRSDLLFDLYPGPDCLFPQVELIARLLTARGGIGLPEFLCASRAHPGQLGFQAISGIGIRGPERHGNVEILAVFDRLVERVPQVASSRSVIERQLVKAYTTNLPNEKWSAGNKRVTGNFGALLVRSKRARHSIQLWTVYLATMVLPRRTIWWLKNGIRARLARHQFASEGIDIQRPLAVVLDDPENDHRASCL